MLSMSKTTVFTLQNVPDDILGKSIRRASPHEAPSCSAILNCLCDFSSCTTEYVDLTEALPDSEREYAQEAGLGIIRDAPDTLWGSGTLEAMEAEFDRHATRVNKKKWSPQHNRVVDLRMRWHMYIGETAKAADHLNDQAEVVAFSEMPLAQRWRDTMVDILRNNGVECPKLTSSTNVNYVDNKNGTGIGWHGDGERTIILTLRLHKGSENNALCFHWMRDRRPVGKPLKVVLRRGDAYIMSVKATGNDWKNTSILTLQHAAGGFGCVPSRVSTLYEQSRKHGLDRD